MQYKNLNTYVVTHKDSTTERINAENVNQVVENLTSPDTAENPVTRILMQTPNAIRTPMPELPDEITFTATVVGDPDSGSIATPSQGTIHVGDEIQLKAVAARNYRFVHWKRNDEVISLEPDFLYTMTALIDGEDFAAFTATFELDDIHWSTATSPDEATGDGCFAFPTSGVTPANTAQEFLAVEKVGWHFDHWERNGENVGGNSLLQLESIPPLADNETQVIYMAVFTEA